MNYGILLSALKRYDESERSYSTALSRRPYYPDCYYNLGVLVKKITSFLTKLYLYIYTYWLILIKLIIIKSSLSTSNICYCSI